MTCRMKDIGGWNGRNMALIAVVFAALAIAYSLATNLKGGPDETAHFFYIRTLAVEHALPAVSRTAANSSDSIASYEAHQPPLYYAVMALPYAFLNWLGTPLQVIWRILRILGVAFGVLWIYSVYYLAASVFRSTKSGLAVAAFVALIPTGAYMAGVVNNDMMISMWFCWALVFITKFQRDSVLERRSAILLGLIIGAAILTKAQGLLLVPIFLLVALVALLPGRRQDFRAVAGVVVTVLLTATVVSGWWVARSVVMNGTIQPESVSHPLLRNGLTDALGCWPELVGVVWTMCTKTYIYFWTPFWLVKPFVDAAVFTDAILLLTTLPLLGLLARMILVRDLDARSMGLLFVALALVFVSWLRYILVVDFGANLQGRLFLPVAPVAGIAVIAGLQPWFRSRRAKVALATLAYGGLVCANLMMLRCVLAYYALGYG